jgi:hypothetical protein
LERAGDERSGSKAKVRIAQNWRFNRQGLLLDDSPLVVLPGLGFASDEITKHKRPASVVSYGFVFMGVLASS